MVSEQSERPALDSLYFPPRCSRVEYGRVRLDSATGWENGEYVDKDEVLGGEKQINRSFDSCHDDSVIPGVSDKQSASAPDSFYGLPGTPSDKNDIISRPHSKHPRNFDEDIFGVAFKRARLANVGDDPQLDDCSDEKSLKVHCASGPILYSSSVEILGVGSEGLDADKPSMYVTPAIDSSSDIPNVSENMHTGCKSVLGELPIQAPLENSCSLNSPVSPEGSLLSIYDRFPRKHVVLGPDHQVDVPSWGVETFAGSNDERSKRLMGTSILDMHDSMALFGNIGAGGGNDCNCIDRGSINCTRRHVAKARDSARDALGHEKFAELGFHGMGEDVAMHWTEEEELLFLDVVFANPASMDKNFWKVLSWVFPMRSSKDIVSYYFNVFMLRKRAKQNRCDPLNVDSDNDEGQDSSDGQYTMEDSGPGVYYQSPLDRQVSFVEDDGEEDDEDDDLEEDEFESSEGPDVDREINARALDLSCKSSFALEQPLQNTSQHSMDEHDGPDDSCTSYEGQHAAIDSCTNPFATTPSANIAADVSHKPFHDECMNNSVGMGIPSSFDPKEWDVCYFSSSDKVDFLPTCYVIEEVFGKDSWDNESGDGHGM